jgi:hypothetical protein
MEGLWHWKDYGSFYTPAQKETPVSALRVMNQLVPVPIDQSCRG